MIGGVVVAPRASELIFPVALAVQHRLTVDQVANAITVYPSMSGLDRRGGPAAPLASTPAAAAVRLVRRYAATVAPGLAVGRVEDVGRQSRRRRRQPPTPATRPAVRASPTVGSSVMSPAAVIPTPVPEPTPPPGPPPPEPMPTPGPPEPIPPTPTPDEPAPGPEPTPMPEPGLAPGS